MIMDTLGALALATEPPTDDLMKREPVGRKGDFISNVMWRNILGQALYQFVVIWFLQSVGKWVFFLRGPNADVVLNTLIFNTFVFCQVKKHLLKNSLCSLSFVGKMNWPMSKDKILLYYNMKAISRFIY
jgi:Ca2+-transporting ATPase